MFFNSPPFIFLSTFRNFLSSSWSCVYLTGTFKVKQLWMTWLSSFLKRIFQTEYPFLSLQKELYSTKLIKEHSHVPNLQQGPPSYLRKHPPSTKTDILSSNREHNLEITILFCASILTSPTQGSEIFLYPPQIFRADSPLVCFVTHLNPTLPSSV